jgi:hypothetical protein
VRRPRHPPADDAPGEVINDKRHVDKALPRGDVGEVCQPQEADAPLQISGDGRSR